MNSISNLISLTVAFPCTNTYFPHPHLGHEKWGRCMGLQSMLQCLWVMQSLQAQGNISRHSVASNLLVSHVRLVIHGALRFCGHATSQELSQRKPPKKSHAFAHHPRRGTVTLAHAIRSDLIWKLKAKKLCFSLRVHDSQEIKRESRSTPKVSFHF